MRAYVMLDSLLGMLASTCLALTGKSFMELVKLGVRKQHLRRQLGTSIPYHETNPQECQRKLIKADGVQYVTRASL